MRTDYRETFPSFPPCGSFLVAILVGLLGCDGSEARPALPTLVPETQAATPKTVTRPHPAPSAAFAPCPLAQKLAGQNLGPEKLIAEAEHLYKEDRFAPALSCANLATDLAPEAVEPHHMRAVALAALGRANDARTAFAVALALDPEDPQTLAAAADFYINVAPDPQRAELSLGLVYARQGAERAASRRRQDRELRSRLWLLQAQAENDLGRSDAALPLAERALALNPGHPAGLHERGIALFNLCRFSEAKAALEAAIAAAPEPSAADPYTYFHLALIAERTGKAEARSLFDRARKLSQGGIPAPVLLAPEKFRAAVTHAIAKLPKADRALLAEVKLEIADVPALADLTAVDPPFPPTILGLYRGLPLGEKPHAHHAATPSAPEGREIILYRKNLARAAASPAELLAQIRRTLRHEIGHLRGLSEADLRHRGLD